MSIRNVLICLLIILIGGTIGFVVGQVSKLLGELEFISIGFAIGLVIAFVFLKYATIKQSSNLRRGIVKWFNPNKGFGFIEQDRGEDLFVHRTEIKNEHFRSLNKDDRVEFEVASGKKGPVAKNVRTVSKVKNFIPYRQVS